MNAETIRIISRYIDENPNKNNSEIARIILEKSKKLELSEGSLRNYIAQIKALPAKVVDTTPGNFVREVKKETPKEEPVEQPIAENLTIHDHIKGYLVAYSNLNFTELAKTMHENEVGLDYSLGTLRNYIAKNAKDIGDTVIDAKNKTSEQVFKEVKSTEKKQTISVINHEILIVDQSIGCDVINTYLRRMSDNSNLYSTVAYFSINNEILCSRKCYATSEDPSIYYQRENDLGINLLEAISSTISNVAAASKFDKVNLTILTSGFDNQSKYLDYGDIRNLLDRLRDEYNWNINLIFTGSRREEGNLLAVKLGVDTSNTFINTDEYAIANKMYDAGKNRLIKINNRETPIVCFF